jgi:hypothetical protein
LNQNLLPADYFAIPLITVEGRVEVDVGSFRESAATGGDGAVATATWAPPRPALALAVDFADLGIYEIQVRQEFGGPQLRAAIELVSPGNKDRPGNRHAFAVKCASYLQSGVSVVVVDVVTQRTADLHAQLLDVLRLSSGGWQSPSSLYAVAYRIRPTDGRNELEVWPEALAIGARLPTLPVWLDTDLAVPLDLEHTYQATCAGLRIRD